MNAALSLAAPAVSAEIRVSMLEIELLQLRKAARVLATAVLAQPAMGMEQLSEPRQTANAVLAALGPEGGK